jgi:hypothetical protein
MFCTYSGGETTRSARVFFHAFSFSSIYNGNFHVAPVLPYVWFT